MTFWIEENQWKNLAAQRKATARTLYPIVGGEETITSAQCTNICLSITMYYKTAFFWRFQKNVSMNWSSADCDVDQKFAKIASKTCQAS